MTAAHDVSLRRPILLGWLLAAIVLTLAGLPAIVHLWFPDPDDAMRLDEVRDWLAGQSWWDVSQHRLWDGAFAMHWSRLVDIPLAAVMVALRPALGPMLAERIALVAVPLATLLALMTIAALLTRRLAGREAANCALLLVPLSVPIVWQIHPMRIDHHGWQIVLALAAVAALVGRPRADARSGLLAGAALATLLVISLEGLPISAAIVAATLLAWAMRPARRTQAMGVLATLPPVLAALHAATRGPQMWSPACDAIAPAWIAAVTVGSALGLVVVALPLRAARMRAGALVFVGAGALATLLLLAPGCLAGPFATLDPLVYTAWYRSVAEGLPIWEQDPATALSTIAFPVVGLAGSTLAFAEARRHGDAELAARWAMLLALLAAGFVLAVLVVRTGATANALALPGGGWALAHMLARARRIAPVLRRTLATATALLVASPGLAASTLLALPAGQTTHAAVAPGGARARVSCTSGHEIAALARLPRATLMAPVDVTPALLAWTDHRAIGAGYHRNDAAIHRVLATFLSAPARAHALVLASRADYVVGCPGDNETELYRTRAPAGLWSRLERGERFDWLEPVDTGSPALAWRVIRPGPPRRPLPRGTAHP